MTRSGSSADDALSPMAFNHLVDVARRSEDWLVNTFIILMAGVLGMRCGEIAHMTRKWVDFSAELVRIPGYEPCTCRYCKDRMKKKIERKMKKEGKLEKISKDVINISDEQVMKKRWKPKTKHGIRSIPIFFNPELKGILKEFFDTFEKCPLSVEAVNNRIVRLGRLAGFENVYPHALRATAALKLAIDGANAETIRAFMGWKDISQANVYIRMAGKQVSEAMEKVYPRKRYDFTEHVSYRVYFLNRLGMKLMRRKRRKNEKEWLLNLLLSKYCSKQKRLDIL